MPSFRPTCASPPSRFSALSESVSDTSHAALLSAHELKNLSPQDVELIEAVMRRAGADATSFQSVLSSYNDILKERGLNAHEAVYFAKLLKIGTLKGRNWGDKWNIVKEAYGYVSSHAPALSKVYTAGIPMVQIPSHERTISPSDVGVDSEHAVPQYQRASLHFPHRVPSPSTSEATPASSSNDVHSRHLQLASTRITKHNRFNSPVLKSGPLLEFDSPPLGLSPYRRPIKHTTSTASSKSSALLPSSTARRVVAQARERKGSIVNETDVWKNIELQRHEKDADRFREDKLQERYWEIWKLGFQWIQTTSAQIVEARDSLLIRENLQRWRERYTLRNEFYRRVEVLVSARRMRSALNMWRRKLNEKRESQWRQAMRFKMKAVKDKREQKLIESAWAKWRQNDSSRSAQRHYSKLLLHGMLRRWKARFNEVDNLQYTADNVSRASDISLMKRSWKCWRRGSTLQATERVLTERIDLRIVSNSLDLWRGRSQALHTADDYRNFARLRYFLASWRNKLEGLRVKEERAKKHLFRQDHLLVHAVMRVWRARERGIFLESEKSTKILKNAFSVWKNRLASHKVNEDLALASRSRSDLHLVVTAMHRWRQIFGTHQNALSFAVQYHAAQAKYRMLLTWRIGLRKKVKMIKMGRLAERYFATRAAWRIWNDKLDEKRRENQLKEFQKGKLRHILQEWLRRTHKLLYLKSVEVAIGELVKERILRHRLTQWTNRVIEIKVRELELVQQHNTRLQLNAFRQWKRIYGRRAESLSLLENYLIVKREEMAGRMFHRWLTVARVARHRRLTLQFIEDQLRIKAITNAWDKWRGSFIDAKLHPIENNVLIRMQKNLLFRAFGLWHSRTKSLPAIRFHGTHLKTKYFKVWRLGMPRALQGKEARHYDKNNVLRKALAKWTQTYRTKIALKAVARARYLRLPAAIPRQVVGQFSTFASSANPVSGIRDLHRSSLRTSEENEETMVGSSRPHINKTSPFSQGQGTGVIGLLRTSVQTRRSVSPPRPRPTTRLASPTQSVISATEQPLSVGAPVKGRSSVISEGDGGRKFWLELHEARRKAKPPCKPFL